MFVQAAEQLSFQSFICSPLHNSFKDCPQPSKKTLNCKYIRETGTLDDDLPTKSMGLLVYPSLISQYCHSNKPPLELHLHASFTCALHEVNRLLSHLSICFLSHSSTIRIPHLFQSFSTFFTQSLQKSAGHRTVLSSAQFFYSTNFGISKLKHNA